jgi:hypothetical protein
VHGIPVLYIFYKRSGGLKGITTVIFFIKAVGEITTFIFLIKEVGAPLRGITTVRFLLKLRAT